MATTPLFEVKFQKVIERGTSSLTILSASEAGVAFGPKARLGSTLDGYDDSINVFTEVLELQGAGDTGISLGSTKAKSINISASRIVTSSSDTAVISARGNKGIVNDGGQDIGRLATNGGPGRAISVFISQVATTPRLRLDARGGDGATTNNLDIPAGTSGSGGTATLYGLSSWAPVYTALQKFQLDFSLPDEWTKEEEQAAQPLDANDDRILEAIEIADLVLKLDMPHDKIFDKIWESLSPLLARSSLSLIALTRIIRRATYRIKAACEEQGNTLLKEVLVGSGNPGQAALIKGERGKNGISGERGVADIWVTPTAPNVPAFPVLHPLQCRMVLEKARAYFYFGDEGSCRRARAVLRSLATKLGAVLDRPAQEIAAAIRPIEVSREALGISPATDITAALKATLAEANDMYFQLTSTSVDYYSLRQNWVPRSSVGRFQKEAEKVLLSLADVEKSYLSYQVAVKQLQLNDDVRQQALKRIDAAEESVKDHISELRDVLRNLRTKIQNIGLIESIKAKNKELDFQIRQLKTEVMVNFSVSLESVKTAVISVAKEPSKEAAGKEAAKLVWEGISSVPNTEGEAVPKSLILKNINTVAGNLADKFKGFTDSPPVLKDGQLDLDPQNGKLLLATSDQIEQLCNDFAKESFSERAVKTRDLLREYVALVTGRNADIVQYNLVLKDLAVSQARIEQMRADASAAQRTLFGEQDADQLQQMAELVEDIFTYTRARAMKLISYYRRSIYFSTLNNPDPLELGGSKNDAALSLQCNKLSDMQARLESQLFSLREKKGSDASRFPANYERDEGKYVQLTPLQLAELKDQRRLIVNLSAVSQDFCKYPDFKGCADVRAYRVRFWLDGLVAKPEVLEAGGEHTDQILVKVGLTHRGDSVFYDVDNQRHEFSHDAIPFPWSYRIPLISSPVPESSAAHSRKRRLQAVDSGDIVNYSAVKSEENTAYAAPSAFASWQISLRDLDERLDLSKVTRARLEFFGTNRLFANETS